MRFLADENVPLDLVEALRNRDHHVLRVQEVKPGIEDWEVLQLAADEDRILITFDKDFGQLVFEQRRAAGGGVLLVRPGGGGASAVLEAVLSAVEGRLSLGGKFTVVEGSRIRQADLPSGRGTTQA